MNEQFPIEGQWWLPGTPNHTVAGRLEYSEQSGGKLTLLGALNNQSKIDFSLQEHPIILGRTHEVSEVSLMDCKGTGSYGSLGGHRDKETYRPTVVFLGKHFTNKSEVQFKDIYTDITHLNVWADLRAIDYLHEENAE